MAANIAGLRRNIKNVAHNYTDAQVKVRAATSNDPWGPSSTQMSEIADLTYNVIAFAEIMQMIWKRVNDSGKNWRHVYKALVLLEYLIKTGSEKVAAQCKENLFSIQTLKDFQFIEENKDQGLNVREKAKSLVALLKDDERLKNERVRALKAKERFAQSTAGIGSDTIQFTCGTEPIHNHTALDHREEAPRSDMEMARPQTVGEEELQLQLALAMSREEAETEEHKKKSDDMRLSLAIQKSKEEKLSANGEKPALNDLVDLRFDHPAPPQRTAASGSLDPWSPHGSGGAAASNQPPPTNDPWGGTTNGGGEGAAALAAAGGVGGALTAAVGATGDPWGGSNAAVGSPAGPVLAISNLNSSPSRPAHSAENWATPLQNSQALPGGGLADPWGAPGPSVSPQPWTGGSPAHTSPSKQDPFSPPGGSNTADLLSAFGGSAPHAQPVSPSRQGQVAALTAPPVAGSSPAQPTGGNPWDLTGLDPVGSGIDLLSSNQCEINTGARPKNTVESLLGEHSNLVNLDSLVKSKQSSSPRNPFAEQPNPFQAVEQPNPFQAAAAPKPTINQLRTSAHPQSNGGSSGGWPDSGQKEQQPFF